MPLQRCADATAKACGCNRNGAWMPLQRRVDANTGIYRYKNNSSLAAENVYHGKGKAGYISQLRPPVPYHSSNLLPTPLLGILEVFLLFYLSRYCLIKKKEMETACLNIAFM